jgi:hypothetical protein
MTVRKPLVLVSGVPAELPSGDTLSPAAPTPTGTSFPGSPTTNDRFYRTDRAIEYYWDGTRWLSTQIHYLPISSTDALLPLTGSKPALCRAVNPWAGLYAIFMLDGVYHSYISANMTWTLDIYAVNGGVTGAIATRSTSGDWVSGGSVATHQSFRVANNAVLPVTYDVIQADATLVSGTGSLYCTFGLTYRLIG